MGKRIYTVEEINLQGWDKSIKIHPLAIKKFRKLADIMSQFTNPVEEGQEEKKFVDVLLEGCAFCMETFEPKLSDPDVLGDYLDWPTMEYILEIAGGIKLNDPNMLTSQTQMAGKN